MTSLAECHNATEQSSLINLVGCSLVYSTFYNVTAKSKTRKLCAKLTEPKFRS